ncbi:alpha/beta fold hydrolase [Reichenbachiella sp. MALMAid0571]|uniref:dienelactone hydrolase family protein n=1 Tax=Reichenbachiella sp. MALMAid0571 TaxID=3143939 RepID=UPI0032DEDF05
MALEYNLYTRQTIFILGLFLLCSLQSLAQTKGALVETPVNDAEFERIKEYYSYDTSMPSDPVFYGEWPSRNPHTLYKISYRSAREQRVPAYLAIPKERKSEKQPVIVLMHGWNLFWGKNEDWVLELIPLLTAQGYAVLAPDHFLFGERKVEGGFDEGTNWSPYYYRDWMVQSVVDLRRGIDYLLTRPDIDPDRIAVMGASMGGWIGSILVGVEPRIKTSILTVPATEEITDQTPPARVVNTSNFVTRYGDFSMLMVIAKKDSPKRNARAKQLFEMITIKKKWIEYDQSHYLNPEIYIQDLLVWLEQEL